MSAASSPTFRELLADFYRIHDASKLPDVDAIAERYEDRPRDLALFLETKYAARYFDCYATHFRSRFFDPARALYDDAALPPLLDTQPLDSLHKAQRLLPAAAQSAPVALGRLHGQEAAERDRKLQEVALGHKLGLVDFWADQQLEGPLALLRALLLERARVRAVTCGPGGVRGCLRGQLLAFDGGGSMVLQDVEEAWVAESAVHELQPPPPPRARPLAGDGGDGDGAALPQGWAAKRDAATGRAFYHHAGRVHSQWARPAGPEGTPRWRVTACLRDVRCVLSLAGTPHSPRSRRVPCMLVAGTSVLTVGRDARSARTPEQFCASLLRLRKG